MSTRWRFAALVLAGIAFVATLMNPGAYLPVAPILEAAAVAVSVVLGVWLYEAIFIAIRLGLAPDEVRRTR